MWMTLLFGCTAAVFLTMTLSAHWHLRWVPRLPTLDELLPLRTRIRCSVVIAARDEAARIEQTIRRLIEQRGVELEIIVVDDRSIDRRNTILSA